MTKEYEDELERYNIHQLCFLLNELANILLGNEIKRRITVLLEIILQIWWKKSEDII